MTNNISNSEFNKIVRIIHDLADFHPSPKNIFPDDSFRKKMDKELYEYSQYSLQLFNVLLEKCCEYTYATFKLGTCKPEGYADMEDYREDYKKADLARKKAHNELIYALAKEEKHTRRSLTNSDRIPIYPHGICPDFPDEYIDHVDDLIDKIAELGDEKTILVGNEERKIRHKIADWAWGLTTMCITDFSNESSLSYDTNLDDIIRVSEVVRNLGQNRLKEKVNKIVFYDGER